ncbi:MAG: hypothetical protein EBU90_28925 [Proteobacteria bacterium]|nr:hypothetical protein [Pseudomonadota bacterium]
MSYDCPTPDCQVFAGYANEGCKTFDRNNFAAQQTIYDTAYHDLINNFGVNVNYFVNTYNLSAADNIYGEHPIAPFANPVNIRMYVEVSNNAITLQKFGFVSDDEFTGYLHIQTFTDTFSSLNYHVPNGQRIEPKSGDVVALTDLGYCRPGDRGPRYYEITERVDQDIPTINPLLGTYIWRLKGKRLEYSFEPNLSGEPGNYQVYDNTFNGVVSSHIQDISEIKTYPGDVDTESNTRVFAMSANRTDIYGGYGY